MKQELCCTEMASAGKPPYLREFQLKIGANFYFIKVTHPAYIQELMQRNAMRPPAAKVDENLYAFRDIDAQQLGKMSEHEVCLKLSETPIEILKPYLTEQVITEENPG